MFKCNGKKVKIEFANTDLIAQNCLEQSINKIYK